MNGGARIFQTARQMGVFSALTSVPMTALKVAESCAMKERPVKLLLDGLCGLKVLARNENKYMLTPVMQFLSGNYQNLSNKYWDHLPELLKTGIPMAKMDDPAESEKRYQAQVTALDWMMRPSAEVAATMLEIGDKLKGLNILDVGAGSAVWSLTFAQKDPASKITAIDWPSVLAIAQASAEKSGLADRFTTLPGNYHDVELAKENFDLIIVSNVTHIETEEGNQALFRKAYDALKPDGKIAVFDVFGDQENGILQTSLYALGLALRTEQGQVYEVDTLQTFLENSGFNNCIASPIKITPYTMGMLVADKQA